MCVDKLKMENERKKEQKKKTTEMFEHKAQYSEREKNLIEKQQTSELRLPTMKGPKIKGDTITARKCSALKKHTHKVIKQNKTKTVR